MKLKILILSFLFFGYNLKYYCQDCPELIQVIVLNIQATSFPPVPQEGINSYYMAFNIGPTDLTSSYENIIIDGVYTNNDTGSIGNPVLISYTMAGWFYNGTDYFVQYFGPNPDPNSAGHPRINIDNFTVPSFGSSAPGPCTYIDGVLPVEDFNLQNSFSIFPNPVKKGGEIFLNYDKTKNISGEIYDIIGKTVLQITNSESVDISNLNSGIYSIKLVLHGKSIVTKKLIITD